MVRIKIGLFTGLFCLFFEQLALFEDGFRPAEVDVGGVQIADAFVVVFVVVPVPELLQRAVERLG